METDILYYGDNLEILRHRNQSGDHDYFPDNSVDLIYLDPPFNSQQSYNVLFKEQDTSWSPAQIKAFGDTWHWRQDTEATYRDLLVNAPLKIAQLMAALIGEPENPGGIGRNDVTAYLVMMTIRLIELHRVLKPTGSLFLHCDPTASHYLKLVLDQIFGPVNFRNEIVWAYTRPGTKYQRQLPRTHDTIFWYSKSNTTWIFNTEGIRIPYSESTIERGKYSVATSKVTKGISKRVLPAGGKCPEDWWQIAMIQGNAQERLGYPTQKPLALLERIIKASSNEGDVVLDPFCGCGTALVAAHKLNRKWIGIDITHFAIAVVKRRLQEHFRGIQVKVIGEPVDLPSAKQLAKQDRYQFQWWALSRVDGRPLGEKKKGADKGIDGVIPFTDAPDGKLKRIVISVKSGKVGVSDLRELRGVIEANNDPIGILLTLKPLTGAMVTEAAASGFYDSSLWQKQYPRIQILTLEEIFQGKQPNTPPTAPPPKASSFEKVGKKGKSVKGEALERRFPQM